MLLFTQVGRNEVVVVLRVDREKGELRTVSLKPYSYQPIQPILSLSLCLSLSLSLFLPLAPSLSLSLPLTPSRAEP